MGLLPWDSYPYDSPVRILLRDSYPYLPYP